MKYKVNLKDGSTVVVNTILEASRYFVGYLRDLASKCKTDEELQQLSCVFGAYLIASGKVEIINA